MYWFNSSLHYSRNHPFIHSLIRSFICLLLFSCLFSCLIIYSFLDTWSADRNLGNILLFCIILFVPVSLSLSLSLDCRLRICYLLSVCYFPTLDSKNAWIKKPRSKVCQSFSDFLSFSFIVSQFGAYYWHLNLANVANTRRWIYDTSFWPNH